MISDRDGMEVGKASSLQLPFCPNGQIYTVVAGDTLFLISQRFGVCLQQLIEANPQIENPNLIYPGQLICIPAAISMPECRGIIYTVVSGDTLFRIAQRFNISLEALLAANPQIMDPDLIYPGQKICIPEVPSLPCPTGITYVVMPGDTLFAIAERLGTTVDRLLQLNPQITDPNFLQAGDLLCVPLPVTPVMPVPIPEPIEIEPCPPMPVMPCPPEEELPFPYIPEQPILMPQPYPYEPMPCPPESMLPLPCPPEPVLPRPCPPEPALPLPCPEPVVPVMPAPYPYCPDPYIYAAPMIRWENCPYAPRRKDKRRFRRRRRRRLLN